MARAAAQLPVERDARGVPLLHSLPEILAALESEETAQRVAGALCLASLIDGSSGQAASLLGEYMRAVGAHELLVGILRSEADTRTLCWLLTSLGNACSDVVDSAASTTRESLAALDVIPCVHHHLQSSHKLTQLHAAACLQNLCKSADLADASAREGVHNLLERLCSPHESEALRHFAAGALVNMHAAGRQRAPPSQTTQRCGVSQAAHSAMESRRRKELCARAAHPSGAAGGAPFSRAVHPVARVPGVPTADAPHEQVEELAVSAQPPTEDALQTRIPLIDLSKAAAHALRRRSGEPREDDDGTSSNSSWGSFLTALSASVSGASVPSSARSWGSGPPSETPRSECNEV